MENNDFAIYKNYLQDKTDISDKELCKA